MIKEIIVVEGKDDTAAVKRAVAADTIETRGSAVNKEIIREIRLASERRGVIIFTDPDHAGERIRKLVSSQVPGCKHAFLTQEEAKGKTGYGVEHASDEAIRKALENVKTEFESADAEITMDDLMQAGLVNHPEAAGRRLELGKILGIGYCNGKQFYKRCKMFCIGKEEFTEAVRLLKNRGSNNNGE
jgi:ribonuclease M5